MGTLGSSQFDSSISDMPQSVFYNEKFKMKDNSEVVINFDKAQKGCKQNSLHKQL